ncbi:MAG: DUF1264 domain-containing protein [Gemmataceae bacterium]
MNRREALLAAGAVLGTAPMLRAEESAKNKACALAGTPLDDMHLYLCAFHVAKKDPKLQVEAHHYCMEVRPGLFQCIIIENNKAKARFLGIEYIVSGEIFRSLPEQEKQYWHPHDYEVASGLLVAPNLSAEEDTKLMDGVKGTWGKTWHTWPNLKDEFPLGEPVLMWAFDKDGQIDPALLKSRDKDLKIDTAGIRKRRAK